MRENSKPLQILRDPQQNSAKIYIFGDIVSDQWFEDETSPTSLRKEIEALEAQGVNQIDVHVDSYGGSVSAAWAIYNVLKDFKGTVNSYANGFVASAAVYPFLAGKKRAANPVSAFFLHQAWISAAGNADELRKAAADIEKFNTIGLEAFAAAGIDKERVLQLEKDETWLSAAEAYDLGLATEIVDRSDGVPAQQSVRAKIVQALTAKDGGTDPSTPLRSAQDDNDGAGKGFEGNQEEKAQDKPQQEDAGKAETGGRTKSALRAFLGL